MCVCMCVCVHVYMCTCVRVYVGMTAVWLFAMQETRNSLSLEMLGLMYRMNERDIEWENVISPE